MPRKRGAPKGNKNACKHGFYSRTYTKVEDRELSQVVPDYRQDNIKFFKVVIARTAERIKPAASNPLTFHENLDALQAVVFAINRLHGAVSQKYSPSAEREGQARENMIDGFRRMGMSEADIERGIFGIVSVSDAGTKRGGQPRNNNAVKHGFFATHYRPQELGLLEDLDPDDLSEEMVLLLVLMKRVFIGMQGKLSLVDFLRSVRILASADACLARLHRITARMHGASVIMAKAYKELSKLAFDED